MVLSLGPALLRKCQGPRPGCQNIALRAGGQVQKEEPKGVSLYPPPCVPTSPSPCERRTEARKPDLNSTLETERDFVLSLDWCCGLELTKQT